MATYICSCSLPTDRYVDEWGLCCSVYTIGGPVKHTTIGKRLNLPLRGTAGQSSYSPGLFKICNILMHTINSKFVDLQFVEYLTS